LKPLKRTTSLLFEGIDFGVIVDGKLQLFTSFFDFASNLANQ